MKNKDEHASRAEKRVLWEVRKRYQLDGSAKRQRVATPREGTLPHAGQRTLAQQPRHVVKISRGKPRWGRRISLIVFLLVVSSVGIFGYKILAAGNKISVAEESLLGQLKDLLFSSGQYLAGEKEDRVNVLLIAVGGEGHNGENLADTIMVASIRPSTNTVALLSIPRDLYVQVPGENYFTKINAVHAYGESQKKNNGPEVLRDQVEEMTGQPMHYYARIDFTAFKNIVDTVGGVNTTIENSFTDYWHKISFPAGTEKMNGERALAYVRARYIEGSEGGDFKRAARQQQILLALRDKVFSVNTAFDFRAVNAILDSLSDNIRTDMQLWEMKRFFELARMLDGATVHSVVLSTGPSGVLVGATEVLGGTPASVLRPRTGDYSEIQAIAGNIFSDEVSKTVAPSAESQIADVPPDNEASEATPSPQVAKPTVEIRNGTNVAGLAAKSSEELTGKGYEVVTIGNAANRSTTKTTVYAIDAQATDGAKVIADFLSAQTDSGLPEGEAATEAKVLIILGADAN